MGVGAEGPAAERRRRLACAHRLHRIYSLCERAPNAAQAAWPARREVRELGVFRELVRLSNRSANRRQRRRGRKRQSRRGFAQTGLEVVATDIDSARLRALGRMLQRRRRRSLTNVRCARFAQLHHRRQALPARAGAVLCRPCPLCIRGKGPSSVHACVRAPLAACARRRWPSAPPCSACLWALACACCLRR